MFIKWQINPIVNQIWILNIFRLWKFLKFTSSKNCCVFLRMCFSSVNSAKFFFSISSFWLTSLSSFSSFSNIAWMAQLRRNRVENGYSTSKSNISRGGGGSGFSPVSSIGIPSFFISRSKNPSNPDKLHYIIFQFT